jgi:hypothetical protein
MNKYVLVVQRDAGHDECACSLVAMLNRLGIPCIIAISAATIESRGNIFSSADILYEYWNESFQLHDQARLASPLNILLPLPNDGKKNERILEIAMMYKDVLFTSVFFTTYEQPDYMLAKQLTLNSYTIEGFIHGPHNLLNVLSLLELKGSRAIVFSRRMLNHLARIFKNPRLSIFYLPCIFSESTKPSLKSSQETHISIGLVGKVDFSFRQYNTVIDIAKEIRDANNAINIEFTIIGGQGKDGINFQQHVDGEKLNHIIKFPFWKGSESNRFLSYPDLFLAIKQQDYTYSISTSASKSKVSGVANLSLDLCIPILYSEKSCIYDEYQYPHSAIACSNLGKLMHAIRPEEKQLFSLAITNIKHAMFLHNSKMLSLILGI